MPLAPRPQRASEPAAGCHSGEIAIESRGLDGGAPPFSPGLGATCKRVLRGKVVCVLDRVVWRVALLSRARTRRVFS
jgi:hypothetical protein